MRDPRLVLASRSPRRRKLLRLLRLPFDTMVAKVDETPRPDEAPEELVVRLSRAKAHSRELDGARGTIVIACDTVVALAGGVDQASILGKPRNPREAKHMLRRLRGCRHTVYSAVTLLDSGGHTSTEVAKTVLRMRDYSETELAAYVASGDPLDKAGAYAIQHQGFDPVRELEGCYASVMGLPLCHVARSLRRRGIPSPVDVPAACQGHTGHPCTAYQGIIGS
ncbi:MAG: Maf family protein [Anaerolineae bacterium]